MSHCLRDRTLWLLSEGEASQEDRAHVASCAVCAARLRRLERDLSHLRSALTGPMSAPVTPGPRRSGGVRWAMTGAALAAMLMLAWVGMRWQQPAAPTLAVEAGQQSIWSLIEGVSAALFSSGEIELAATPERLPDLADLRAALAGEWPCEEPEAFGDLTCDDETLALLSGEQ